MSNKHVMILFCQYGHRKTRYGERLRCMTCESVYRAAFRLRHPALYRKLSREGQRKRRAAKPELVRFENWKWMLRREYGLSVEDYQRLVEKQRGRCAICARIPEGSEKLCIDHDHHTSAIRGLLCLKCNSAIGLLLHDTAFLRQAILYLEGKQ